MQQMFSRRGTDSTCVHGFAFTLSLAAVQYKISSIPKRKESIVNRVWPPKHCTLILVHEAWQQSALVCACLSSTLQRELTGVCVSRWYQQALIRSEWSVCVWAQMSSFLDRSSPAGGSTVIWYVQSQPLLHLPAPVQLPCFLPCYLQTPPPHPPLFFLSLLSSQELQSPQYRTLYMSNCFIYLWQVESPPLFQKTGCSQWYT